MQQQVDGFDKDWTSLLILSICQSQTKITTNTDTAMLSIKTYHPNMSHRKEMGKGEDDQVVDGGGGGELGHREQGNCCQQVNLKK